MIMRKHIIRLISLLAIWPAVGWADSATFGLQSQQLTTTYTLLSEALNNAAEADTIVVTASGTMDEQVTIPDGVVLLVPFDEANTLELAKPIKKGYGDTAQYAKPVRFRELTLTSSASITIAGGGAVSVGGIQYCYQGRGAHATGAPQGNCGFIHLMEGSAITVEAGGMLYAWGYIYGPGLVTIQTEGTLYEMMQLKSWRGGNVSQDMAEEPYIIFPFNSYFVQNIESPILYEEYAYEYIEMGLIADNMIQDATAQYVGSDAFLNLYSDKMQRTYNPEKDQMVYTIDGYIYLGPIVIPKSAKETYNSSDYVMGISSSISFHIVSGELDVPYSMALQPGSEIIVEPDAYLMFGADDNYGHSFYVYDYEQAWQGKNYAFMGDRPVPDYVATLDAAPAIPAIEDAKIVNNGIIETYSSFYTTEGGANICSTDAGVINFHQIAQDSVTYQVSGKKTTPEAISVTSVLLKNEDGSYTITADAEQESTFEYKDGKWINSAQTPLPIIDQNSSIHRKFIHNGQLYIRHKQHTYNAQGM